jgi:hypothetical protein
VPRSLSAAEIEEQLNRRLAKLEVAEAELLAQGVKPSSWTRRRQASLLKQVTTLTAQLGRRRKDEAAHAVWMAEQRQADAMFAQRLELDGGPFWFRRFHTSLAIAHGAAFAAVIAHVFDPESPRSLAVLAEIPLVCFAIGMCSAGLIPVALHSKNNDFAWLLALTSGFALIAGLVTTIYAVDMHARQVTVVVNQYGGLVVRPLESAAAKRPGTEPPGYKKPSSSSKNSP